jgi:hypothetical protein
VGALLARGAEIETTGGNRYAMRVSTYERLLKK